MQKFYIGDDQPKSNILDMGIPKNYEELQERVGQMDIYAEVERYGRKGKVKVMDHAGTTMMLASGGDDQYWLQKNSYEKKRLGSMTVYYFVFPSNG